MTDFEIFWTVEFFTVALLFFLAHLQRKQQDNIKNG